MLEREWIIKAIEQYQEVMYDWFNCCDIKLSAKIDKSKNQMWFIQTIVDEDSKRRVTQSLYNLEEFIKDCQEKLPIALEIEKKYGGCLVQYGCERMAFIIDIYKQAKQLKEQESGKRN